MDLLGGAARLLIVAAVLVLVARIIPVAWANRRVATTVWRRIRLRHVGGSLLLLTLVLGVAGTILLTVPGGDWGLGRLVGITGNAVFAPIEELATRTAPSPAAPAQPGAGATAPAGPPWAAVIGVSGFLLGLVALFPWLAYVEERTFREGLEDASIGRQVWSALRFGLLHLIMLIPIGAAMGISVAGFVYGRIYRRGYRRAGRPTATANGPWGVPVAVAVAPAERRREGVLDATVWHTAFNSTVALLVLAGFAIEWFWT